MLRCDDCQDRLMALLYGLLDADEQAGVQEHLAGCPAGQAAVARARGHQGLLAAAAKMECPGVSCRPPEGPAVPAAADPSVPTQVPRGRRATVLSLPRRRAPARPWRRWAVA